MVWACLTLALAGPRWNFREMETFSRDQSLVILLDLSESMNATDIKPSRLIRAKQKIEDLIHLSKGVKIGFIAFAADPHMITPLTDDKETIRHLLPSLDTDLVYVQGSRLSTALDMAMNMLESEPGNNKAILVISDGGFEDGSAIATARKIAAKGVVIHVMGIGTAQGAPLLDHEGNVIKKNGVPILSHLEKERLSEISHAGNGRYLEAHYSDQEEGLILRELEQRAQTQIDKGKSRFWDERFYLLIFLILPIILWWFRRGYIFPLILILFTPVFRVEAASAVHDYFKNSEELGKQALDDGDYETAIRSFQDSYRKGVACYRAGNFEEAEKLFRQSSREDVASQAAYNLGNSLVQQQKIKEAITAYEDVLKEYPDHTKARDNLELIKKMLDQHEQENSQSDDSDHENESDKSKSENENKNNKGKSKGSNDTSQNQQQEQQQQESSKNSDQQDDSKSESENDKMSDQQQQKSANDVEQNREQGQQQDKKNSDEQQNETAEKREEHAGNDEKSDGQQEQQKETKGMEEVGESQKEDTEGKAPKSQEDQDADLWLNQISNDPKTFMKNKFYIESKKNGTTKGIDPW